MKPELKYHLCKTSRSGAVVRAYLMAGFKISNVIQIQSGQNHFYMHGRGVRVYIDENGATKFVARAKVAA